MYACHRDVSAFICLPLKVRSHSHIPRRNKLDPGQPQEYDEAKADPVQNKVLTDLAAAGRAAGQLYTHCNGMDSFRK